MLAAAVTALLTFFAAVVQQVAVELGSESVKCFCKRRRADAVAHSAAEPTAAQQTATQRQIPTILAHRHRDFQKKLKGYHLLPEQMS